MDDGLGVDDNVNVVVVHPKQVVGLNDLICRTGQTGEPGLTSHEKSAASFLTQAVAGQHSWCVGMFWTAASLRRLRQGGTMNKAWRDGRQGSGAPSPCGRQQWCVCFLHYAANIKGVHAEPDASVCGGYIAKDCSSRGACACCGRLLAHTQEVQTEPGAGDLPQLMRHSFPAQCTLRATAAVQLRATPAVQALSPCFC